MEICVHPWLKFVLALFYRTNPSKWVRPTQVGIQRVMILQKVDSCIRRNDTIDVLAYLGERTYFQLELSEQILQKKINKTPWQIWIDTGGTFTDCLAKDPHGNMHRAKVLSTSALRGMVAEQIEPNQLHKT